MKKHDDSGFTLVEVLMAVMILLVGLVGIANLFIVAGSSTTAAGRSTVATAEAAEVMERLKAIPFDQFGTIGLATKGDLTSDVGGTCNDDTTDCVVAVIGPPPALLYYNMMRDIPGIGFVKTRWTITGTADREILFFRVRSESMTPLLATRSRAEFTMFRTCTNQTDNGCPPII